jgi:PPM family protein phosphatase
MDIINIGRTDVGLQRKHNEDFMLMEPEMGLFVVCDGMGGHLAGDQASRMAAETIKRVIGESTEAIAMVACGRAPFERLGALLRQAIETACHEVYDEGQRDRSKHGMGSTCTALLICCGKAVLGHVGDSRLYLCRGGSVTQLSKDHTFLSEAVEQGLFTPEEAAASPYKNVITRAIGKERNVMVDTLVFDIVIGDTLLLCSDGLHGYTKDAAELAKLLSVDPPDDIAEGLVKLANARGGSDNITALVLRAFVREDASSSAADARRSDDVMCNLATLQQIELLRELSTVEIMRFAQIFQEVRYTPGAVIMSEGEVSDTLFVLVQGSAEVTRGDERLAVLPAGAHFGEMALLNSRPRSATVRALEASRLLVVDRPRLYAFLQQDGMLAAKFFWKLAETLSRRLDDVYAQQEAREAAGAGR